MHIFTCQSEKLDNNTNGIENLVVEKYFDFMNIFVTFWNDQKPQVKT